YPVEVGLVGDSARTLQALLPLLGRKADRGFLETAQEGMKGWHALMEDRATRADTPMKPQVLARELGRRLRSDAIVACDSGTIATWWARNIPVRRGQMQSLSGNLATTAAGFTIENPADCGRMLEEALATPGPVVVQGVVDPSEPPLPARVTLDQAAKFARSLLRGEPNSQKIALTVLADRIRELV